MAYLAPNLAATGTTFAQFQAGGPSGMIEKLITAQVATVVGNPLTVVTFSANGVTSVGGSLAPGVYYLTTTALNGLGETTTGGLEAGPLTVVVQPAPTTAATIAVGTATTGALAAGGYYLEYTQVDAVTGGESTPATVSAVFSVAAGNTPTATFPALTLGMKWRNVYLTPTNQTHGTETLYATGVTTTTYVLASALWQNNTTSATNAPAAPVVNNTSTNIPLVTFATGLTNATANNVYLTPAGGNTGSEVLYADGITTTTFALSAAAPAGSFDVKPPATNSTSLAWTNANGDVMNKALNYLRSAKNGLLESAYRDLSTVVRNFNSGNPVDFRAEKERVRTAHICFAGLAQICQEMGVLIDANAGTIRSVLTPIGNTKQQRTWP